VVDRARAGDDFELLATNYQQKYEYRPAEDGPFFRVSPAVIVALDMSSMETFAQSPTRFRFEK
jgi:hypothetical protein